MGTSREVQLLSEKDYKLKLKDADKKHGSRRLELIGPYNGMAVKALHKCKICGNKWEVLPRNLIYRLQGCPECRRQPVKPLSYFRKKLKEVHGNLIMCVVERNLPGVKPQLKVTATCSTCGHTWHPGYHNLVRGSTCPECAKTVRPRRSIEEFVYQSKELFGDRFDYSKVDFTTSHDEITLTCSHHGDFLIRGYIHLLSPNGGCKACYLQERTEQNREVFLKAAEKFGARFTYHKVDYKQVHAKVTINCLKHGEFKVRPYWHLESDQGGCPGCVAEQNKLLISQPHQRIIDLLVSKNIPYFDNNREQLDGKELDIWLPRHRLGIEINGIYWHSSKFKNSTEHYAKALLCKERDIKLLQFWDFEINGKSKIVASIIRAHVGKSKVVYARKLEVTKLDPMTARKWFQDNHLQGAVNSTYVYGLVDLESHKVLCAMSFGKPRFSKHEWEMLRFANHLGYTVVGGASRLLAAFVRDYSPKEVVSYADLRYSQGNMYKQLGFEFSHRSAPNYFYMGKGKRLSRYVAQKHRLPTLLGDTFDPSKTETENMEANGFFKVFDAGNLVYVKSYLKQGVTHVNSTAKTN